MIRTALATTSLFLLAFQYATAQTATVEVTIQAVKPEAKEITVTYNTNLGDKTVTLDVSRKAEITLNGKEVELDAIGPGLTAKVDYHKELAVVTKIVATGTPLEIMSPELVELKELQGGYPCLSPDGLTVYWEGQGAQIYTAHRDDVESVFGHQRKLLAGRHPAVSDDGLEIVFIARSGEDWPLHIATRDAVDRSFRRVRGDPRVQGRAKPQESLPFRRRLDPLLQSVQ